jgi:aspartyl protease family protein
MRELPLTFKAVTVFALLGTAIFLAASAWEREQSRASVEISGVRVSLQRAPDGHYHWPGRVGGEAVDFLVDTGASRSAIPGELADRLSLPAVGRVTTQTAGGPVQARVVLADIELQGGVKARRLPVIALPDLRHPLLGMDLLGRIPFQQDGGRLHFELDGSAR